MPHLKARDTTLLLASRAPLPKLISYRERLGWGIDWVSSDGTDFNRDLGFQYTEDDLEGVPRGRDSAHGRPERAHVRDGRRGLRLREAGTERALPHVLRASGDIDQIAAPSDMPLGVRPGTAYCTRTATLRHGDAILLVTDGVIEAMNAQGALYGADRLEGGTLAGARAAPADIVRVVTDDVHAFAGTAPKADDLTVLALRWFGAQGGQ